MTTKEIRSLSGEFVELEIVERMYVDGEFVDGVDEVPTENPATGETLAAIPVASPEQVDCAVQAARRASEKWSSFDMRDRRDRLHAFADELEAQQEPLTNLDVAENGSCISKLHSDTRVGAEMLRYFAGLGSELKGETIPTDGTNLDYTRREPVGAVAGIVPFNHPLMFLLVKAAPALTAGNGIVLKPSEITSLSALYLGKLVDETGLFPDGLINVVTGGDTVGKALAEHPDVDMVSMTGSVPSGKSVMKSAADHLARPHLELGGKNPFIVFPDVDPDAVARGAVNGMNLAWQGQSCGSGSRLLVHEDVYDAVVPRVVDGFESITPGDPFDRDSQMGTIVSEAHYERVLGYIETARSEGATLLTGGSPVDEFDSGYFVEPTVFEADQSMTVANEEIFGPVLTVISWSEYDEMISVANAVEYGLTASIWTNDLQTAHHAAADVEAGYVWVNQHGDHFVGAPFGGYKESGLGRQECFDELLDHTRVKNVNVNLDDIA